MDVAVSEDLACPSCGEQALPGDVFCENCGAPLRAAAVAAQTIPVQKVRACASCGGTEFADGYCTTCGAPAVRERDHWAEQPAAWLAAVCDRGIRHTRNEDAVALACSGSPRGVGVLVVCDGVSSSTDSDIASLAAARAARDVLAAAPSGTSWPAVLAEATDAANQAVVTVTTSANAASPPSCTFVAAVMDGTQITAGWVGDSRAYWLPDAGVQGAQQLSRDDSWAADQMSLGMPREEAESAPQAHAITRWLGVDSPHHAPRIVELTPEGPGWLLVCSDGLWNYCSSADAMHALVVGFGIDDPAELSARLVGWANEQGGHDNITVALARWETGILEADTMQRQET